MSYIKTSYKTIHLNNAYQEIYAQIIFALYCKV